MCGIDGKIDKEEKDSIYVYTIQIWSTDILNPVSSPLLFEF